MNNSYTGAGVIVFFDNRSERIADLEKKILYLCLENHDGSYDLPKGHADIVSLPHKEIKENPFVCAVREMREETNLELDDLIFNYGINTNSAFEDVYGGGLLLFIGEVTSPEVAKDNPAVLENPKTKEKEHKGLMWLSKIKCKEKLPEYLYKGLEWASEKIDLF
jgi:8-oxo-dGTP pyrophosphatase MutT (NUDIX family)